MCVCQLYMYIHRIGNKVNRLVESGADNVVTLERPGDACTTRAHGPVALAYGRLRLAWIVDAYFAIFANAGAQFAAGAPGKVEYLIRVAG